MSPLRMEKGDLQASTTCLSTSTSLALVPLLKDSARCESTGDGQRTSSDSGVGMVLGQRCRRFLQEAIMTIKNLVGAGDEVLFLKGP